MNQCLFIFKLKLTKNTLTSMSVYFMLIVILKIVKKLARELAQWNQALLRKWRCRFPRKNFALWYWVILSIYMTHLNEWEVTLVLLETHCKYCPFLWYILASWWKMRLELVFWKICGGVGGLIIVFTIFKAF